MRLSLLVAIFSVTSPCAYSVVTWNLSPDCYGAEAFAMPLREPVPAVFSKREKRRFVAAWPRPIRDLGELVVNNIQYITFKEIEDPMFEALKNTIPKLPKGKTSYLLVGHSYSQGKSPIFFAKRIDRFLAHNPLGAEVQLEVTDDTKKIRAMLETGVGHILVPDDMSLGALDDSQLEQRLAFLSDIPRNTIADRVHILVPVMTDRSFHMAQRFSNYVHRAIRVRVLSEILEQPQYASLQEKFDKYFAWGRNQALIVLDHKIPDGISNLALVFHEEENGELNAILNTGAVPNLNGSVKTHIKFVTVSKLY